MNPKETYDGAVPSGNSMMAYNLVRLYQLTENEKYNELARKQIRYMSAKALPAGHSMFLLAKMVYDNPPEHIVIAFKGIADLEKVKQQIPLFANVNIVSDSREYPLINGSTTFYVCRDHTCLEPQSCLNKDLF